MKNQKTKILVIGINFALLSLAPYYMHGISRRVTYKGKALFKEGGKTKPITPKEEAETKKAAEKVIKREITSLEGLSRKEVYKVIQNQTKALSTNFDSAVTKVTAIIEKVGIDPSSTAYGTTKTTSDFFDAADKIAKNDKSKWPLMHRLTKIAAENKIKPPKNAGDPVRTGGYSLEESIKRHTTLSKDRRLRVREMNVRYGAYDENYGVFTKSDARYKDEGLTGTTFLGEHTPIDYTYDSKNLDKERTASRLENFLDDRVSQLNKMKSNVPIVDAIKVLAEIHWALNTFGINHRTMWGGMIIRTITHPSTVGETWDAIEAADKLYKKIKGRKMDEKIKKAIKQILLVVSSKDIKNPVKYQAGIPLHDNNSIRKQVGRKAQDKLLRLYEKYGVAYTK